MSGSGCDKTYYTTDGTTPTTSSSQYSSTINISVTTTLKFFSTDLASNSETVRTQTYTIDTTAPNTTASPPGGVYSTAQDVSLTCNDGSGSGCDNIYYTTDGTTPTTSSSVYSSPINIAVTTTLKFFAKDVAGNSESVQTQTYFIGTDTTPPTTTPAPTGGTYNSGQSVTLTCNDGAGFGCDKIYYTTDGTTPTTSSPVYSSTINVSVSTTLKFFAKDFGGNSETVKTENYTIDTTPPAGTITINSGAASTNSLNVTLTLTCDDASGCSQMKFSNDVDNEANYSTPETYSATKAWALSSGGGTKTVYAKFKDSIGNWSIAYSDTINLVTDSYTKSLLHMNGTDQSTTFTDNASGGSHTWTAHGNAQIDTAQKKFGTASGLFDGTGDYIDAPDSADWAFGSGNFTIDFWAKRTRSDANEWVFCQGGSGWEQYWGMQWSVDNYVYCNFRTSGGSIIQLQSTITISDTSWHHYAYLRDGNTLRLFIDGVARGTADVTGQSQVDNAYKFAIGRLGEYDGYFFAGGVDEFRISKGIARWTSNFTPPSNEY